MSEQQKERLIDFAVEEMKAGKNFILPVHLDLHSLTCVVGSLQLALRHPANTGPSSKVVRELIDGIIERVEHAGYVVTAQILRLGDNPEYDEPRTPKYELLADGRTIKCLACGKVSHNPNDVAQRYCGNCHRFHEDT
jgi:hypothetical protein